MSIVIVAVGFLLQACAARSTPRPGATASLGYTYVPTHPLPVTAVPGEDCTKTNPAYAGLLDALPDNSIRMSVERFERSGLASYTFERAATESGSYRVTVDYMNTDTTSLRLWIRRTAEVRPGRPRSLRGRLGRTSTVSDRSDDTRVSDPSGYQPAEWLPLGSPLPERFMRGTELYEVRLDRPPEARASGFLQYNIPLYVGVGLRVTSVLSVLDNHTDISGLAAIGSEAEAEKLSGSLFVQTLGINGTKPASALPIQSELNRTTAMNAVQAIGAVKALLQDEGTSKSPRAVGMYLPFPATAPLINEITSALLARPIPWPRRCRNAVVAQSTATRALSPAIRPRPRPPEAGGP